MFLNEPKVLKDDQVNIKLTREQKTILKRMAKEREMAVSVLVMHLLELEYNQPVLKHFDKQVQQKIF